MGLSETLALICTIFMGHDLSDGLPTMHAPNNF